MMFVCVKQKTAYELRISDWSSDVCSSDLRGGDDPGRRTAAGQAHGDFQRLERRARAVDAGRTGRDLSRVRHLQAGQGLVEEIGRASCRERVCQYVEISVVAVSLKKKELDIKHNVNQIKCITINIQS